jgi:hypothetical protein
MSNKAISATYENAAMFLRDNEWIKTTEITIINHYSSLLGSNRKNKKMMSSSFGN